MALAAVDEEQEVNSAIENALVDAQRASELVPTDDEYRLLGTQPIILLLLSIHHILLVALSPSHTPLMDSINSPSHAP